MNVNTSKGMNVCEFEKEFIEFLIKKIGKSSLKLQHVTRQLQNLRHDMKNTLSISESDVLKFIEKHKDIFNIDNGLVTVRNYLVSDEDYDSSSEDSLPDSITNGIGVIVKLLPTWGIISGKEPIKTSVYFSAKHFLLGYKEKVNLPDYGLYIGAMMKFNAQRETFEKSTSFTTKYRATKVWKKDEANEDDDTAHLPRKYRKAGLYDAERLEGEGVILRVFLDFGFIAVKGDRNNTVYFCRRNIVNYDNIDNLNKLFKKDDLVEFTAHRAIRQDTKARWVAIKVWKKSGISVNIKKPHENTTPKSVSSTTSITSSNQSISLSESYSSPACLTKNIEQKCTEKEMICNEPGKICPRSNGAVIKFGEDLSQLADGDSSVYYIAGTEVTEISWEFSEGEDVYFDAVRIKSAPGWKALLVWIGDKPDIVLETYLDDLTDDDNEEDAEESVSVSGSQLSRNSLTSEKSILVNSEISLYEIMNSSEVTDQLYDLHNQSFTDLMNDDKICKRPNLPPFKNCSQNSVLASRESKFSNKVEYEKSNMNQLYNSACKSNTDSKHIPQNDGMRAHHSEYRFPESSVKTKIDDGLKNGGVSDFNEEDIKAGNIKKFEGIIGKIVKVYPKYARLISSDMPNPVTFYGRNFYWAKKSSEDLKDLKKVLRVGDSVHFNYFEIIDNFGQTWNKVSMAWIGPKPICYHEKTIYDIIQQNSLSVTLERKSNPVQPEQQQQTVKESVTTDEENLSLENRTDGCISRTESCSDVAGDDHNTTSPSSTTSEITGPEETPLAVDIRMLSKICEKILRNKVIFENSEIDFAYLAVKRLNSEESTDGMLSTLLTKGQSANKTSDVACSCEVETSEKSHQTDNTDDIDVQSTSIQNLFNIIMFAISCFLSLKYFYGE